jgi:GT2 family glycosyltransferase
MTEELSNSHDDPRILMVIPTLGQRTELLRQTLDSLKNQSPIKFDTVMIFPLKNKETQKLAKDFGAMIVKDPGGISAAVNAGISIAKPNHEYIGWIGDDDLLTKDSLKYAIEALDTNPKASLAFGYCDYIDDNNRHIFTSKAGKFAPWVMTWGPNLVPLPGIVFRKSALDIAGKFDVNNKYSMDLDMLLRLRKIGNFINTKRVQACFRWHKTSQTVANRPKVLKETEQVKRKYLSRFIRPFSPLWEMPVRWGTKIAVQRVEKTVKNRYKE